MLDSNLNLRRVKLYSVSPLLSGSPLEATKERGEGADGGRYVQNLFLVQLLKACTCRGNYRTYREWFMQGYQVKRGEKATKIKGVSAFCKCQVQLHSVAGINLRDPRIRQERGFNGAIRY